MLDSLFITHNSHKALAWGTLVEAGSVYLHNNTWGGTEVTFSHFQGQTLPGIAASNIGFKCQHCLDCL